MSSSAAVAKKEVTRYYLIVACSQHVTNRQRKLAGKVLRKYKRRNGKTDIRLIYWKNGRDVAKIIASMDKNNTKKGGSEKIFIMIFDKTKYSGNSKYMGSEAEMKNMVISSNTATCVINNRPILDVDDKGYSLTSLDPKHIIYIPVSKLRKTLYSKVGEGIETDYPNTIVL